MIRIVYTTCLAALAATSTHADPFCDDLWFSRNQLFDRAGYCFSSPLGQALFDNAGCVGTDVTLEPGADRLIAHVHALEAENGCNVDTSRTALDVSNIALRLQLDVVVAPSEYASGCLGWTGAPIALHAGPRMESPVIAEVRTGDDIAWEYEAMDWPEGWEFVTTYRDGLQLGLGWLIGGIDYDLCSGLAG